VPRKLLVAPQATRDIDDTALRIAQAAREQRGDDFLDATLETYHQLGEMPFLGSVYPFESRRLRDLRRWFVKGFPDYVIFYRSTEDILLIVRVLQRSRDLVEAFDDLAPDEGE